MWIAKRGLKKSFRRARLYFSPLLGLIMLPVGCSKSPYDVAPVQGRVTIDGQPMSAGQVMFAPLAKGGSVNAGKPAFGKIQSDGSYILSTYRDDDGAVVGEHTVTIYDVSEAARFSQLLVPGRRTVVADEDNQINIEITTGDIRRFGHVAAADD